MEWNNHICFYSEKKKYGYLSNFYPSNFEENGIKFNCNEQYFMYYKLLEFDSSNIVLKNKLLNETDPMKIKKYGRNVRNYDDKIWHSKRYNVMLEGLKLKFSQNEELKKLLLSTKGKKLYEASPYDKAWGVGLNVYDSIKKLKNNETLDGGLNLLGKALEDVRDNYL